MSEGIPGPRGRGPDGHVPISEDLIAEEEMVISITSGGYIKRLPVTTYRAQRRGERILVEGAHGRDHRRHAGAVVIDREAQLVAFALGPTLPRAQCAIDAKINACATIYGFNMDGINKKKHKN